MADLTYDEFDDQSFNSAWTIASYFGSEIVERADQLHMFCDGSQDNQTGTWIQTDLTAQAEDFYFDLYIKTNTSDAFVGYDFAETSYDRWIGVQLDWDGEVAGGWGLYFYCLDDPTWVDMPPVEAPTNVGAGCRVWVRFRYDPDRTPKFAAWYSFVKPETPTDWIWVDFGQNFTTVPDLEIYGAYGNCNINEVSKFETSFLRKWHDDKRYGGGGVGFGF